jgi:zinc/manganese transport system substrate-binding protein
MLRRMVVAVAVCIAAVACSGPATPGGSGRVLRVVAGENFWGSIANQIGGTHANVQSVLSDPNADPHEYGSNANDVRAFAQANVVILNGAGYDTWGQKLLDADRSSERTVVTVADVLGKKEGDNPHFWYNPSWVDTVADRITATFKSADSADASYFDQQRAALDTALKPYHNRIAEIRQRFSGVEVGATESIFVYLASALGLDLISPPEFMKAIAETSEPPANTVVEFQNQVQQKQIKLLVYNVQTPSDVVTNIRHSAAALDIPVVGVSETLQPETATFQDWQLAQLLALENALNAEALVR